MDQHRIRRVLNTASLGVVTLLCLVGAGEATSQSPPDTSFATILGQAYSMLRANPPEAAPLFEKALTLDPGNVAIHRQLGYLYHEQRDYEPALRHFMAAENLLSSDTIRLQIAYTLLSLGRTADAVNLYRQLGQSAFPDIRENAREQLEALPSPPPSSSWWTRIYLAPSYDTRWTTSFYYTDLQEGYDLTGGRLLSLYGFLTASGDARSRGGMSPEIISDNTLMEGFGLQCRPVTGLQVNIQEGLAFDLIDRASRSPIRGDFRAVAIYGNGIYPPLALRARLACPLDPFLDVYASLGYYARYRDGIGYVEPRAGLRVLTFVRAALDIYAKGSLVMDTEREFYDNALEGGPGARFTPNVSWGLYLAGEFQRGYYWNRNTTPNPYEQYYSSFRVFLLFDRAF